LETAADKKAKFNINALLMLSVVIIIANIIVEFNSNTFLRVILFILIGIGVKFLEPHLSKITGEFGKYKINIFLFILLLFLVSTLCAYVIEY
jgi:hypothetical protein